MSKRNTFGIMIIMLMFSTSYPAIADHSLREIEKWCEVWKSSGSSYGELECSLKVNDRRSLERKCEVYFGSSKYGDFECRGSHYRNIEKKCEAWLYSQTYAEIDC